LISPVQTPQEARTQTVFRSLLWALSYPGKPYPLPSGVGPLFAVGEALLDLETRFFTPDPALRDLFTEAGSCFSEPAQADYLFFPTVGRAELSHIVQAQRGELLYPDRGATLVLGTSLNGSARRWSGPGIQGGRTVSVGGLPEGFWPLRAEAVRYPLGWDVFLVLDSLVLGLPRTTQVEVA